MKYVGKVQSQANAEVYATASGTLPNGKPVIVNSDGSVSLISATGGGAALGTVASAGFAGYGGLVVGSLSATKFVAFAQGDTGNSANGTAIIGTVSGSSISFGTKVSTGVTTVTAPAVVGLTETKFILVYTDSSGNQGKARVGTVSGTSISFGSVVTFESGQSALSQNNTVTRLTDTKFLISYRDSSDGSKAKSIVGTISGTSVSFGSAATFATPNSSQYATVSALSETKVIIAWSDTPSSARGRVIVGTISGTSISYGSAVNYDTSSVIRHSIAALSDTKFVIAYQDGGNSSYLTAICGTVSGTSITLGTAVVFNAVNSQNYFPTVSKINENQFGIAFADFTNSAYGTLIIGTASGTSLSFGTKIVYTSAFSGEKWATLVGTTNFVIGYDLTQFSAINYQLSSSNLTAENFVGITNGVVVHDAIAEALGSETVFGNNPGGPAYPYMGMAFDLNANRVVIAYRDLGNDSKGTVIVGAISGTSISFGTPVVLLDTGSGGQADYLTVVYDSNSNKVVISFSAYFAASGSSGRACVGTVNPADNSISIGTLATFTSGNSSTTDATATFDSNSNKVVIAYGNSANSGYGTAVVGTVSGTNISFGTAVVFESASANNISSAFDSNSNKVVIGYKDVGNSNYGTSIVGTVSGTGISFGTAVVFNSGRADENAVVFDSNSNKIVIAFMDGGDNEKGKAVVGTVSGTGISYGSEVTFSASGSRVEWCSAVYNSKAQKVIISYRRYIDSSAAQSGELISGTVSGTSISFGTATQFNNAGSNYIGSAYDSTSSAVVTAYSDAGNSNKNTAIVYQAGFDNTVRGSTASGSTAIIQAGGAISTLQTGLTPGQQYFVQTDGTLGLTAATPSVLAGTAVSATDLIVKG